MILKASRIDKTGDVIAPAHRERIFDELYGDLAEIPDGSTDLILTGPPYSDNLIFSAHSVFYQAGHQFSEE